MTTFSGPSAPSTTTFKGPPDAETLRFCVGVALSQPLSGAAAWDLARATAPDIAGDVSGAQFDQALSDIKPQIPAEQLASSIGAFAYGFTGKAAG